MPNRQCPGNRFLFPLRDDEHDASVNRRWSATRIPLVSVHDRRERRSARLAGICQGSDCSKEFAYYRKKPSRGGLSFWLQLLKSSAGGAARFPNFIAVSRLHRQGTTNLKR